MKFFQYKASLAAVAASLALVACGNVSKVHSDGTTDEPVWPNVERVNHHNDMGTFPNLESLKEVKAGMTKDQLYYLLGRPHFGEGIIAVREWDYLFHFHTPGQGTNDVTTCQFKVLFDRDVYTRSFFWKPVDPASAACPPGSAPQRYTVASDALFGFDQATLSQNGRQRISELANEIRGFDELNEVVVYGHTDRLGSDAYNMDLSQRRADAVRDLLVQQGVPSHLIRAQGMGKNQPVVQCENANRNELVACLAPNRRVEITVNGSGLVK